MNQLLDRTLLNLPKALGKFNLDPAAHTALYLSPGQPDCLSLYRRSIV